MSDQHPPSSTPPSRRIDRPRVMPAVSPPPNGKQSGAIPDGGAGPGLIGELIIQEGRPRRRGGQKGVQQAEGLNTPRAEAPNTGRSPVGPSPGGIPTRQATDFKVKQDEFLEREKKVNEKYAAAIPEYRDLGRWYLRRHRRISVALLVCAVLAPVLIASNKELLGIWDHIWITRAAVTLSIIVALLEGLRRIFKYDDRAAAAHHAQRDLVLAREKYRREKLRHPDLTPERYHAFEVYWATYYEDIYNREVSSWTKAFKEENPGGDKPSGNAQTGPKRGA